MFGNWLICLFIGFLSGCTCTGVAVWLMGTGVAVWLMGTGVAVWLMGTGVYGYLHAEYKEQPVNVYIVVVFLKCLVLGATPLWHNAACTF